MLSLIYAYVTLTPWDNGFGNYWIVQKCPFCGKKHSHAGGGPGDDPQTQLGSRVPHCSDKLNRRNQRIWTLPDDAMYWLTTRAELNGQPVEPAKFAYIGLEPSEDTWQPN